MGNKFRYWPVDLLYSIKHTMESTTLPHITPQHKVAKPSESNLTSSTDKQQHWFNSSTDKHYILYFFFFLHKYIFGMSSRQVCSIGRSWGSSLKKSVPLFKALKTKSHSQIFIKSTHRKWFALPGKTLLQVIETTASLLTPTYICIKTACETSKNVCIIMILS